MGCVRGSGLSVSVGVGVGVDLRMDVVGKMDGKCSRTDTGASSEIVKCRRTVFDLVSPLSQVDSGVRSLSDIKLWWTTNLRPCCDDSTSEV